MKMREKIFVLVIIALVVKVIFFPATNDESLRKKDKAHQASIDSLQSIISEKDVEIQMEAVLKEDAFDSIRRIDFELKVSNDRLNKTISYVEKIRHDIRNRTTTEWDSILTVWYPEPGVRGLRTALENANDGRRYP